MSQEDKSIREWEYNLLVLISKNVYEDIKSIVNIGIINFSIKVGESFGDKDNKDILFYNPNIFSLNFEKGNLLKDIAKLNNKNNAYKALEELEEKQNNDSSENIQNVITESDNKIKRQKSQVINSVPRQESTSELVYIDGLKHINGWSSVNSKQLMKCQWKLKYNRVINNFYYFNLKAKESFWSWAIIVISTFTGLVTLGNNVANEPFMGYHTGIKILLTICTAVMTLIASWIKKQQYVERINNVDRYLQKLNKLCEELDIQLILTPTDRIPYVKFREAYLPLITEYLASNPLISPTEWKESVYQITKYYPEIIAPDNIDENKLWPWFGSAEKGGIEYRPVTKFGHSVLATYEKMHNKTCLQKYLCCCCYKYEERSIFKDIYKTIDNSQKNVRTFKKGDKIKVISKKPLRHIPRHKRKEYIEKGLKATVRSANINDNMLFYNVSFDSPTLNQNKNISNEYHTSKIVELKQITIKK